MKIILHRFIQSVLLGSLILFGSFALATVAAAKERDSINVYRGSPMMGMMRFGDNPKFVRQYSQASSTPFGNTGEPIIGGNVTAISSSTMTVKTNTFTYTVNTSHAKIANMGMRLSTTSPIAVGDRVIVQGTVNGTSVTASSIIVKHTPVITSDDDADDDIGPGRHKGFVNAMGNFFSHMFWFFGT